MDDTFAPARSREGYRTFAHTGDLGLEVWADTPERLHALAAVALLAQVIEARDDPRGVERRVVLEGDDAEDLFVHWLSTALLEAELLGAVWTDAEVRALTDRRIEATLLGPRRDRGRQVYLREVKAVSRHALELDLAPGHCRCRVVLDL